FETVVDGANWFQVNRQADGTRASSSVSYLHPNLERENLHVLTGLQVMRVLFDEGQRATGVEYIDNAFDRSSIMHARREVILSAGAIDTPKLLMLSGIGPADHLREVGIDVRVDSPGVGSNLQDHPEAVISWESTQTMTRESTQWWEIGIFAATEEGLDLPDLMMHYGSVPFDMHTRRQGYPTSPESFALTPNVTHARSRGTVRLRSIDYRDKPKVDPRYFTDEEGHDMRVAVAGIRKAREIVSQPAMDAYRGRELFPGEDVRTDEEIAEYVAKTRNTVYHPSGSCRMGAVDDDMSPLDPQLRVKGVTGLRVVDGSVMPQLVAVNPNITTILIGERAADRSRGAQEGCAPGAPRASPRSGDEHGPAPDGAGPCAVVRAQRVASIRSLPLAFPSLLIPRAVAASASGRVRSMSTVRAPPATFSSRAARRGPSGRTHTQRPPASSTEGSAIETWR